ncbi:tetratricopeptide repeat protein [Candidatus Oleimmundimicrobium sp.]|uniref:tetratricopeptide repeat protein n=1 Tax=Candidatus Oleimmundimicrobium sp. TaxID=3060597 RepID=UPI00280A9A0A|nr:tetratricopeptide repeat protein [Candidatus Oleimmundimicrobium sp.]
MIRQKPRARRSELKIDLVSSHYSLGILYEEIGEIKQAIIQFKEALKLDSGNVSYKEKLYEFEEEFK